MNRRREYPVQLIINGRLITRIVIDSHYELRHQDSISDNIILALVCELNRIEQFAEDIDAGGFEYFMKDKLRLKNKTYKLIWLLHKDDDFIGIVNAYRRD